MPTRDRFAPIDDLMERRDWPAAKRALDQLLAAAPDNVEALLLRSTVGLRLDRYRDAHDDALRAHALRPTAAPVQLLLARQLMALQQVDAMREVLSADGFPAQAPAFALAEAASLLNTVGEAGNALPLLDLAVTREPRHVPVRYLRGTTRMYLGDWVGAEQDFEACLQIDPGVHQAAFALATLHRQTLDNNHVDRLLRQLKTAAPGSNGEVLLRFALFSELNDLDRHEQAWDHLAQGCRSKRRLLGYDHQGSLSLLAHIAATCSAEFFRGSVRAPEIASGTTPIFIVGMQRSGTTLLERILGGHSAIADGGESYAFSAALKWGTDHNFVDAVDAVVLGRAGDIDYHQLGRHYLEHIVGKARGRPLVTEKLPANFQNIGFIAKALPQARILHMVRDPVDTCFSNLRALFPRASGFSYDQVELAEYYLAYRQLMAHWHRVLPGRILDVHYTRLVNEPERVMEEIFHHCGLTHEPAALDLSRNTGAVNTLSTAQVRGSIRPDQGAAWKPYERHLQPLIERLHAHD